MARKHRTKDKGVDAMSTANLLNERQMKYFNDMFTDAEQRMRMLKVFPPEFEKGYKLYKQGKLKPEYHQVLWLTYFEGFSNKEVALIMKKSVHNIETLVYRARRAIKEELEKEGFVYEGL